jgi:hypothetical protein
MNAMGVTFQGERFGYFTKKTPPWGSLVISMLVLLGKIAPKR